MPRILDTSINIADQAEQGQTIRFIDFLEAVVTIEKRAGEYVATFMLAPVRTRHLLIIHEQTFPSFASIAAAFGIAETEEVFENLGYNTR